MEMRQDISGFQVRWSGEHAGQWLQAGYWQHETLADIAMEQTWKDPDRILLIEGGTRHSRKMIYDAALRLANYLQQRGARPGDVMAFQLPNWSESAIIALAARILGLVINPIAPIYREAELRYMLGETGTKFLFIPAEFRNVDYPALVAGLRSNLPALEEVIVLRGDAGQNTPWEQALACAPLVVLPEVDPGAVFMVMFTSGTTGRAKGVLQHHYAFGYKARQMIAAWNVGDTDVIFMPSPVTHITGAIWAFDIPWLSGAPAVLLDVWSATDGIAAIRRHGCTISGGATPFLQQLLAATEGDRDALGSLKTFFCGGTSVSPELIREVSREFPGCLFFRAYGSTEMMTVTLGISSRQDANLGAETDGIVKPPMQVRLVDDRGDEITQDGVEGEILAFGPEQFCGYINVEDNIEAFDENGFFRMGDLGCWSNRNYLVITGRKKDIIIRSGENISPKEVEDVLMQHPAIADVAIVAMPSATTGEMGCAFVMLKADSEFDLRELRRFLNHAGLAKQKYPEWLEIVDDLPRVPSGKVRKDVLRDRARVIAVAQQSRVQPSANQPSRIQPSIPDTTSAGMNMTTISVANRLAVHELIAQYSHCVDNYRGEAWSELFVEGGRLIGVEPALEGRQAFVAQSKRLQAGPTEYRHLITNVYLLPGATDERAVARAYGTVADWAMSPPAMAIFVEYRFDLVKRGDGWKIAEIEINRPYQK